MPDIEPATFVRDGMAIMEAQSIFLFTVRTIIMIIIWCLAQLPAAWKVDVDVDQIIRSITMERDGLRVDAGPWLEAPTLKQFASHANISSGATSGSISRVEVHNNWKAYCESRKSIIPFKHASYTGPAAKGDLRDEDEESPVEDNTDRSEDEEDQEHDSGEQGKSM